MDDQEFAVVVFRSESLDETKRVAELFERHDLSCSVDREAGAGYVEITEFDAFEDAPCWAVSVLESQASFAQELMESNGFSSMADPDILISTPKPWLISFWRVAIIGWLILLAILVVGLFLDIIGVIDFGRLLFGMTNSTDDWFMAWVQV